MEIQNYINENKYLSYEQLNKKLYEEYKLKTIIDKNDKFYMISATNESDFQKRIVRQCSGIIIEKNTNKVLHYFGERAYDVENNNNNVINLKNINFKNCYISKYLDGYVIKTFNYNGIWTFSTSKHTNIKRFKIENKILYNIFKNVILKTFNTVDDFLNLLEINYCYTFLLNNNSLYPLNKFNLINLKEDFNFNNYFHLSKYKNDKKSEPNEKFIIIEKNNIHENKIINKIHINKKNLEELLHNNICKCFDKTCNLTHYINSNIEEKNK